MPNRAIHAFGPEANLAGAMEAGKIGPRDVIMLDEGKIKWVGKDGKTLYSNTPILYVDELPAQGITEKIYVVGEEGFLWDGTQFSSLGVSESKVTELIERQMDSMFDIIEF